MPLPLADEAVEVVRDLEPIGVGARDLRDCLLMQLDHMEFVRPLTRRIVEQHLDDLAMNKLPKIAKETGASVEEVKESWEFLRVHCNPHPGAEFSGPPTTGVVPDVVIEETDGHFEVKTQRWPSAPDLAIPPDSPQPAAGGAQLTRRSTRTRGARSRRRSGSSRPCTSGRTRSSGSQPRSCGGRRASCATACST